MKKCCECGSDYEDEFYKYDEEIYCFDCLVKRLEEEEEINVIHTIHYYNSDWGELGTDDDIDEVIQNLCERYDVERIED